MYKILRLFLVYLCFQCTCSKEESVSDLYALLDDPKWLAEIEKRLGMETDVENEVGCYDQDGILEGECNFHSNTSTIIKTTESLAKGATFLKEIFNVSCPRECTTLCCEEPTCDTAIFQDKDDHNCYLFQCGNSDMCVFAEHDKYSTGWVSLMDAPNLVPGGFKHSHENDLVNVGSHGKTFDKPEVKTPPPTTPRIPPTTARPGLGEYCESYETLCDDPHAECLMKSCRCRAGYHEKNGLCAFLETDTSGSGNLYNPFYNSPYNSLTGLLPNTNQIYPNQIPANQNIGGQYYAPGSANQNPGGLNMMLPVNQQWPQTGLGSQLYPNNPGYQQQGYYTGNTGYVPVAQSPVQAPSSGLNPYIQPVQQNNNAGIATAQTQVVPNQNKVPAAPADPRQDLVQPTYVPVNNHVIDTAPKSPPRKPDLSKDMDLLTDQIYDSVTVGEPMDKGSPIKIPLESNHRGNNPVEGNSFDDDYRSQNTVKKPSVYKPSMTQDPDSRHSSEEDNSKDVDTQSNIRPRPQTYPPSTKTKTQVQSPTQSTVAGQKVIHNSEGLPDYSWISYSNNDDSQRVSGKKGSVLHSNSGKTASSDKQTSHDTDNYPPRKQTVSKTDSRPLSHGDPALVEGRLQPNDYDADDYRFDDFRRPSGGKQRPTYGRYDTRFDNSRQRPAVGSRYPYYDNGYQRNRGRNPYPVWDPYKDEYYYPDSYDDRPIKDNLEYGNGVKSGNRQGSDNFQGPSDTNSKPYGKKPETHLNPPVKQEPTTAVPSTTVKIPITQGPTTPAPPVVTDFSESDTGNNPSEQTSGDQASIDQDSTDTDSQSGSSDDKPTKTSEEVPENSSDISTQPDVKNENSDGKESFHILNSDGVVTVESYTDSSQGPIVALALGLAITMIMLIFVGCRLRTVKRRLRKGRALHSNEADYLINGMYL